MDAVMFSLKRAFHSSLKFGRAVLGKLREEGMTPARMDVLHLVHDAYTQAEIRAKLGVARSTISEMLGALEKIGVIFRIKNGRTRAVGLTAKGEALLAQAIDHGFGDGIVPRVMDKILSNEDLTVDQFTAESEFHGLCWRFRQELGDTAAYEIHPWHVDEYLSALCEVDSEDDPFPGDDGALTRVRLPPQEHALSSE